MLATLTRSSRLILVVLATLTGSSRLILVMLATLMGSSRVILVVLATLTGSSRLILVVLAPLTGSSRYTSFAWAGGPFFPVVLLCQFLVLAGNRFWLWWVRDRYDRYYDRKMRSLLRPEKNSSSRDFYVKLNVTNLLVTNLY